jgi:hypothetical protein
LPQTPQLDVVGELYSHDIDEAVLCRRAARPHEVDIVPARDDSLAEQKPDRELVVIAGRAHRDRNAALGALAVRRPKAQTNFERLLGCNDIGRIRRRIGDAANPHLSQALPAFDVC